MQYFLFSFSFFYRLHHIELTQVGWKMLTFSWIFTHFSYALRFLRFVSFLHLCVHFHFERCKLMSAGEQLACVICEKESN